MLGLYLASPLDRDTYLVAKAAAVGLVLSLVTLGPPLFMLIARTIAGVGPDGFAAFLGVLWRVVVGGVIVAALPGALSLAIASTTTRRAAASAAFILVTIGSAVITETLVNAGASPTLFVAQPPLPAARAGRSALRRARPASSRQPPPTPRPPTMVVAYLVITLGLRRVRAVPLPAIRVTR